MRHQPALVDRVAGEAAAQMIVDAALADVGERDVDRVPRRGVAVANGAAPQQPEEAPLRKLRRTGEAAAAHVDGVDHAARQIGQGLVPQIWAWRRRTRARLSAWTSRPALWLTLSAPRDRCGRPRQHLPEGGPAEARLGREVGAAPERARLAVEEHGERPAALLAQRVQSAHVDGVDVGALLAVDLDVDEQLVHVRGGGRVLEALVRHDMAPVAGGVADREQDRLARALGLGQRLGAPCPPVDRVVLVLQEIGAGLAGRGGFRSWIGRLLGGCWT